MSNVLSAHEDAYYSNDSIISSGHFTTFLVLKQPVRIETSGFQLEFVSISRVINHMTCYNLSALIGGKFISKKSFTRFALQSECCNFNQ